MFYHDPEHLFSNALPCSARYRRTNSPMFSNVQPFYGTRSQVFVVVVCLTAEIMYYRYTDNIGLNIVISQTPSLCCMVKGKIYRSVRIELRLTQKVLSKTLNYAFFCVCFEMTTFVFIIITSKFINLVFQYFQSIGPLGRCFL